MLQYGITVDPPTRIPPADSQETGQAMPTATEQRAELIEGARRHETDTGSPEVQITLLTERIQHLTGHLKDHRHDHASRRGLLLMVGRRNRLLRFLVRTDRGAYQDLIKRLGLRK